MKRKYYLLIVCITSVLSFLPYLIRDGGFFTLADDFLTQILPFGVDMVRTMRAAGPDAYAFKLDLGTPVIVGYTYYGLFSPFMLPAYLFPEQFFPYLAGILYILKYMTACCTSFFYLRMFTKEETGAMLGSLMYAFSGYSCVNILFYFFHDIIALFPLMLIFLEKLLRGERNKAGNGLLFSVAVCLNCVTNYFFFVQEVLFLVLYALFRMRGQGPRATFQMFGRVLLYGFLGTGMAACVFLPNILYIMQSARVHHVSESAASGFFYDLQHYLILFKGILLPGEMMWSHSAVMESEPRIGSIFLPGGGLALAVAYMIKKSGWLRNLLITLFVLSLSPMMSSVFLLFFSDYYRWWFMAALMLTLAGAQVLDDMQEYQVRKASIICTVVVILFGGAMHFLQFDGTSAVIRPERFLLITGLAVAGNLLLLLRDRRMILAGIAGMAIVTTLLTQRWLRAEEHGGGKEYAEQFRAVETIEGEDPLYRFQNRANTTVIPSSASVIGVGSYTTTASHSLREYDDLFEYRNYKGDRRFNKTEVPGLLSALGARYYALLGDTSEYDVRPADVIEGGRLIRRYEAYDREIKILEYPSSPIAYTSTRAIDRQELMQMELSHRGIALLYAVVLDEQEIQRLPATIKQAEREEIETLIEADRSHREGEALYYHDAIRALSEENADNGMKAFQRDYHGFTGTVQCEQDRLLFVSIPNDKGWHATVNGERQEILNASGMMALLLPSGTHDIRFTYETPYWETGLMISGCALMLSLILFVWRRHHSS